MTTEIKTLTNFSKPLFNENNAPTTDPSENVPAPQP